MFSPGPNTSRVAALLPRLVKSPRGRRQPKCIQFVKMANSTATDRGGCC